MKNPEDVIEPRSECGNLPPELKAMQVVMDMVFGALQTPGKQVTEQSLQRVKAAPQEQRKPVGGAEATAALNHGLTPAGAAPRRMDIETAIMRAPGFDYLLASEIFAALQRRLELRYEDNLNTELADRMARLAKSFDNITGAA